MRDTLLQAIETGYQLHLSFVNLVPDDEKAITGTFENWSAKDTLGHVIFWIENLNIHIQQAMHGTPLTDYEDFNTHNAEDYPRKKPLTWPETLELLTSTFETMSRLIREFPINEADLQRDDWERWTGGRTLEGAVLGSVIAHPLLHFVDYMLKNNHVAEMEALVQQAGQVPYERTQAVIAYNLACYYALNHHPEKAFPLLREAFARHAPLKEWSQQDSDLETLRDLPEYQALLAPQEQ